MNTKMIDNNQTEPSTPSDPSKVRCVSCNTLCDNYLCDECAKEPSKDDGNTLEDDVFCMIHNPDTSCAEIIKYIRSHDQKDKVAISREDAEKWLDSYMHREERRFNDYSFAATIRQALGEK